ncbi:MAG: hypothetical protein Q7R96_02380 [Nanoarchaeota archaeon]|nr:hypothetical protein [Nanoarchaeota archaeon]
MADDKEKNRQELLQRVRACERSGEVTIPISHVFPIIFRHTHLNALVASPTFTEQEVGNLVYIEGGSQHGDLSLIELPREPAEYFKTWRDRGLLGSYDRDEGTRKITTIHLKPDDVVRGAYFGTLRDLLTHSQIFLEDEETLLLRWKFEVGLPPGL